MPNVESRRESSRPATLAATSANRKRASRACQACNARRVKCNVTELQPCRNCVSHNQTCKIAPSKRGRHPRPSRRNAANIISPLNNSHHAEDENDYEESITDHGATISEPLRSAPSNILASDLLTSISSVTAASPSSLLSTADCASNALACDTTSALPQPPSHSRSVSGTYDHHQVFYGESNVLTVISSLGRPEASGKSMQNGTAPVAEQLCYNISEHNHAANSPNYVESPQQDLQVQYATRLGAFTRLDPSLCVEVIRAYFNWFHPCFPIVERYPTARGFMSGTLSPLLLNAMLFVGSSYCDSSAICRMGFKDVADAKAQLFQRARTLFNMDWEKDNIIVLQSLFLMSFWRAPPFSVQNIRYWLASAISLAHDYGFHRATNDSALDPRQRSLWRRIWWSIYVRDRQSSASLGLPSRVRDEDCDVEALSPCDFDESCEDTLVWLAGKIEPAHIQYATTMVRLTVLLGKVVDMLFPPKRRPVMEHQMANVRSAVDDFKSILPPVSASGNDFPAIGAYLLHLSYNYLLILCHRDAFIDARAGQINGRAAIAKDAACTVTHIVENMLSHDLLQFGQMHCITGLFAALCIHTLDLQRSDGVARKLAEFRAKTCLLGLKEIQKYWRVNNVVLDLFFQLIDEPMASKLRDEDAESQPSAQGSTNKSHAQTVAPDNNIFAATTLLQLQGGQDSESFDMLNPLLTFPSTTFCAPSMLDQAGLSEELFSSFFTSDPSTYNQGAPDFSVLQRYL